MSRAYTIRELICKNKYYYNNILRLRGYRSSRLRQIVTQILYLIQHIIMALLKLGFADLKRRFQSNIL